MAGQIRLVFWGLLLGLLSAFLPRYLPDSVSSRLPFYSDPHHRLRSTPMGKRWSDTLHRYVSSNPIAKNYEHSREADWEAEIEQQLRFGSKDGGKELEKEYKRQLREVERRAEHAGSENLIKDMLPVYYVEQGSTGSPALEQVAKELDELRPQSLILLVAEESTSSHLVISSGPSIHSTGASPVSYVGSPRLASHLVRAFAHLEPSGVPATGSAMIKLTPAVTEMLSALKIERGVEVVQILLPVLAGEEGWEAEKWWDAGKALHEYLHAHEVAVGNRRVYKNTVVVAIGSAKPKHAPPVFTDLIDTALTHHTSHARDLALHALYSGSSGSKPRGPTRGELVPLYVATAAAGEGEGHALGHDGEGWRFGHLPIRS
ncbi:hypothetical protein BMF94_4839 [Rhodotorula taiwanensis]|uniref:Uncharacterized protein n=1 Tax=Rhodotorula taiwanensis TaxID=741276 RepID=A0A2S5B5Q7_9BASI|nr:hypothetical protein BMF94_4839 [Rhodotorula taiwanensis]